MLGYKIPRADVTYYSKQASQLISVSTAVSLYRWIAGSLDSGFWILESEMPVPVIEAMLLAGK
ncbi:hypothetical protein PG987_014461 [Apiospora arundinis]